jgi:hypothetical protein
MPAGAIAGLAVGGTVIVACGAVLVWHRLKRSRAVATQLGSNLDTSKRADGSSVKAMPNAGGNVWAPGSNFIHPGGQCQGAGTGAGALQAAGASAMVPMKWISASGGIAQPQQLQEATPPQPIAASNMMMAPMPQPPLQQGAIFSISACRQATPGPMHGVVQAGSAQFFVPPAGLKPFDAVLTAGVLPSGNTPGWCVLSSGKGSTSKGGGNGAGSGSSGTGAAMVAESARQSAVVVTGTGSNWAQAPPSATASGTQEAAALAQATPGIPVQSQTLPHPAAIRESSCSAIQQHQQHLELGQAQTGAARSGAGGTSVVSKHSSSHDEHSLASLVKVTAILLASAFSCTV